MKKILKIEIKDYTIKSILDKIEKYISSPKGFFHITSINPEIAILSRDNNLFRRIINTSQIRIVDGVGIVLAAQMLGIDIPSRLSGVDLMSEMVKQASLGRLRVMLIGGRGNLAENLAKCYSQLYPEAKFFGLEGIKNIHHPQKDEERKIFSIITYRKPHFLFVAFGSPHQELWLWKNRKRLKGIVCMGVGGAFDYLSGSIERPPLFIRRLGSEWLYRLIRQPWRWKRQMRLFKFIWLVWREKYSKS